MNFSDMGEHTKLYDNWNEMLVALEAMEKFQLIHNGIRIDYIELLRITESNELIEPSFDALYRACLRSLFSLIEADIYGLNVLDTYNNYNDKHSFIDKFKETFKKIAKTWKKEEIQKIYFDSKLTALNDLKKMRDELVHPKEINHLHKATDQNFQKLKSVFNEYDTFINDLMNGFFIGTKMPIDAKL
ncbi:MAG: hypothetical protein JWP12_1522 [Bacteroidetes bacterium]|nr:hypothetical protein [Bacteroidota bacterium]